MKKEIYCKTTGKGIHSFCLVYGNVTKKLHEDAGKRRAKSA